MGQYPQSSATASFCLPTSVLPHSNFAQGQFQLRSGAIPILAIPSVQTKGWKHFLPSCFQRPRERCRGVARTGLPSLATVGKLAPDFSQGGWGEWGDFFETGGWAGGRTPSVVGGCVDCGRWQTPGSRRTGWFYKAPRPRPLRALAAHVSVHSCEPCCERHFSPRSPTKCHLTH